MSSVHTHFIHDRTLGDIFPLLEKIVDEMGLYRIRFEYYIGLYWGVFRKSHFPLERSCPLMPYKVK